MQAWENYILSVIFFLILCLIFYLWKRRTRKGSLDSRQKYLLETLELAKRQFSEFNIKFPDEGGKRAGTSAMLDEVAKEQLVLDATGFLPEEDREKLVDVFFQAEREEGPVFYAFTSRILKIEPDYQNSRLFIAFPDHLRIEKKRHFIRVKPDKSDIRVIGVWKILPGRHLPRSTAEIGSPLTHSRPGMENEPVLVENISGSGLALRFAAGGEIGKDFDKGMQLLCLVVYVLEGSEKPVAFWCTAEIMNSRATTGPNPELVLGLEFTNWAVLESSTSEIHWVHSSPTKGAKPILQWVSQIERKRNSQ